MRNKINHAIILAAGRGVRMLPLTKTIPKAMAPLSNSTLIENGIRKIKDNIDNIHITIGYKGALLAKHVIEQDVSSVLNTEGKGNAWWIFNTLLKFLNEPLYVLTCDNVTDINFNELEEEYFLSESPPCMIVPVDPIEGLEGDYIFKSGKIVKKIDRETRSNQYCSGIQVLNPFKINKIIDQATDFYDVWNQLIERELLLCSNIKPNNWFTIDNLENLENFNKISS